MPNYCDYSMKVTGYKDNVDEFIRIINYEYENGPYFARIFEHDVVDEQINGVCKTAVIEGYLAWSVHCCMMPGSLSYYADDSTGKLTNLIEQSKRLNLHLDVWGEETEGMFFQERYKIIDGVTTRDECRDIKCFDLSEFDSYQDMCNQIDYLGDCITENEFKMRVEEEWPLEDPKTREEYGIFDNDEKMVNNIMAKLVKENKNE